MTGGSTSRSPVTEPVAGWTAHRPDRCHAGKAEAKQAEGYARELAAAQYELETAEGPAPPRKDEVLRLEASGTIDLLLRPGGEWRTSSASWRSATGQLTDNDARSAANGGSATGSAAAVARARRSGSFRPIGAAGNPVPWPRRSAAEERSGCPGGRAEAAVRSAADLGRCADLSGDRAEGTDGGAYRRNIAAAEKRSPDADGAEKLAGRGAAFRRLAAITEERPGRTDCKNRAGQEMNENLLNLERAVAKLDQKRATSAMEEKQILDRVGTLQNSPLRRPAQRIGWRACPRPTGGSGSGRTSPPGHPKHQGHRQFQRVNTATPDGPAQRVEGQGGCRTYRRIWRR
ncbi:MAG: hypothetical protein ACLTYN_11270 [Dysosmobacter welbionis]